MVDIHLGMGALGIFLRNAILSSVKNNFPIFQPEIKMLEGAANPCNTA
jgi:hypothetical protein